MRSSPEILRALENESIEILRETAAAFKNPVLLYSIGKDSTVILHLARKAFYPAPIPFTLLHVDSTWNFREMITFRDEVVKMHNLKLIAHINEEGVKNGITPFSHGISEYIRVMNTVALKQAFDKYGFDAAIGGSRRDEERSRAKERIFSVRESGHRWDPRQQRPELWKERPVVKRGTQLIMVDDERYPLKDGEQPEMKMVRFRTLGCYPLTAGVESTATTLEEVVEEVMGVKLSERATRLIDGENEDSMEKKKREGYF
ncbi:MAG: sulfate adenylyltransferase subunit 2 [Actinobacteria bacterium]|nr:sulfate adenylyltransferase subunit 2 [Actinomycetota bacterium]